MDDFNWLPGIEAVEKCLNCWRSCSLSYGGKALVSNALALSRIWYVASLVHIPSWALSQVNKLVFNFFWSSKRDLVARNVVIHSRENGGYSVVSTELKVQSLLVQWIKRCASSSSGWVHLMSYWFLARLGASPLEVFSRPFDFDPEVLPRRSYPNLDWLSTWRSLLFLPLDRQVIYLNWKVAHCVLYTAERLVSFGYANNPSCFWGFHNESFEHLFFSCPLAQSGITWIHIYSVPGFSTCSFHRGSPFTLWFFH